jgi:hypothetical protein
MRRVLLLLLVLIAASGATVYWRFDDAVAILFQYQPPKIDETKLADEAGGRRRDAAYFRNYTRYDRSYSVDAKARADKLAVKLEQDAPSLTRAQFVLRVAEIAGLADNGHTQISSMAFSKGIVALPLEISWFGTELRVLRAKAENVRLLGARIDSIDGAPTEQVFQSIKKFAGGTDEHRRLLLTRFFRSPELLFAAGLSHDDRGLTLKGMLADGSPFEQRIDGVPVAGDAPIVQSVARLLYPAFDDDGDTNGWISFLKNKAALPRYLQSSHSLFARAELPDGGLYVELTFNKDGDDEPIGPFLQQTEAKIRAMQPHFIVIDMRKNGGGDYTTTYDFASRLPQMAPNARIYVLTSGYTFSAAITTTAFIKQAGGTRVSIAGEPVGDRLTFWAEGGRFVLPNVEVGVSYAAGKHDYAHTCWNVFECFWVNYLYPVRVDTLAPDVVAPLTFEAYRNLRDPALEQVLAREERTSGAGS